MKILPNIMMLVIVSSSMGQLSASAAKVKPIKIKMVKTDPASRGKPWTYAVSDKNNEYSSPKTIKKDATLSVIPGTTWIQICVRKGTCNQGYLIPSGTTKDKVLALDGSGNASIEQAEEVQKKLASTVEKKISLSESNSAIIEVEIPVDRVRVPFTLTSAPKASGGEYYDKKTVTADNDKREIIKKAPQMKDLIEKYYIVPLLVAKVDTGEQDKASFIRINNKPGKRIIIRRSRDSLHDTSRVRMGTSENVFFVVD